MGNKDETEMGGEITSIGLTLGKKIVLMSARGTNIDLSKTITNWGRGLMSAGHPNIVRGHTMG
jgi:hypothetical protein